MTEPALSVAPAVDPVPPLPTAAAAPPVAAPWSALHRWAFRLVAVYFALVALPFPLDAPPKTDFVDNAYKAIWDAIVPWVGAQLLHLAQPVVSQVTGSGDTTYAFVQQLCFLALATLATLLWGIVDRRRREYSQLNGWLRISLRYWVGWAMLSYGMSKVLHQQMPWFADKMLETYGEFSGMGLVWAFMGYSASYSAFAGGLEVLGGALLFFRRTATLGGLVTAAVMSNVVMLNLCFDVPVKLYSIQLLLMALFIAAPSLGRLARAALGSGPVEAAFEPRLFGSRRMLNLARVSQALMIVYALYAHGYQQIAAQGSPERTRWIAPTPASGLYQVESFEQAPIPHWQPPVAPAVGPKQATGPGPGKPVSATLLKAAWARISISRMRVGVLFADGSYQRFRLEPENTQPVVTFRGPESAVLRYQKPDPDHLVLEGEIGPQHVAARLKRIDPASMPLKQQGFRWVQESPDNR